MKRAYPSVVAAEWLGANSFQPAGPIEDGIPFFDGPDFRQGILQIPLDVTNRTMNKGLYDRGCIQSWNFIYEQELPWAMTGSIGYVATRSIRQSAVIEANAAPPGGGTAGRPLAQRFRRRVSTTLFTPFNTSNCNSLQASLNRRFQDGLLIKVSYTWSKAIDFNDNADSGLTWNYPTELARNRAIAGYDVPHVFRFAYVYELPFGTGKRWAQNRVANVLLGGWQTNGIFSAYSGRPFTVSASSASLNAPGNSQTADQVKPTVEKLGGIGRNDPYFDPAAFAPVTGARFGSTGRNILRGPGAVHVDLSLFRNFKFSERWNLQFRAEAFNLANTPHFNNPSSNVSSGGFMGITSTAGEGTNADTSERRIRFGLKLTF
jgi:hypothetical protein